MTTKLHMIGEKRASKLAKKTLKSVNVNVSIIAV